VQDRRIGIASRRQDWSRRVAPVLALLATVMIKTTVLVDLVSLTPMTSAAERREL